MVRCVFVNSRTVKDAYTLPRTDDAINTLLGAKFFSKLDLRSGYWQVEMKEEIKHKTPFSVGNLRFYACNCVTFGQTNAPATFQRLITPYIRLVKFQLVRQIPDAYVSACVLAAKLFLLFFLVLVYFS